MREGSEHQKQAELGKVFRRVLAAVLIGCWLAAASSGFALAQDGQVETQSSPAEVTQNAEEKSAEALPSGVISQASPNEPVEEQIPQERTDYADANQQNSVEWIWLGDGVAQWVMAALSLGALIISAWAVCLLSRTLEATRDTLGAAKDSNKAARDAVQVTREIGRDQSRAYVSIENARIFTGIERTHPWIEVTVRNTGQTPAKWFSIGRCVFIRHDKDRSIDSYLTEADATYQIDKRWGGIGGNSCTTANAVPSNFVEALNQSYDAKCQLIFYGTVRYQTMFDEVFESEFVFFVHRPTGYKERDRKEIPQKMMRSTANITAYRKIDQP